MAETNIEKVNSLFELQEKGWRQAHNNSLNKQEALAKYHNMEALKSKNRVKGLKIVEYFGEYYVIYKI